MPSLVIAWLVGEGIIIYRSYKNDGHLPMPGQLLAASGVFAVLGLMAQNERLTFLAGALGWGFDVAAFLNIAPEALTGFTNAEKAQQAGTKKNPQKIVKKA